jgi:hypothetical protein
MSVACEHPANVMQNIRSQFTWQAFAWLKPEVTKLRKHWPLILCLVPISLCMQVLFDVDYKGHDITESGIKIFTWLPKLLGRKNEVLAPLKGQSEEIFPYGLQSVDPLCVKQRSLYDCKFLAAISSLTRSEEGKRSVYNMIKSNTDGSATVTFPGARLEPIQVSALTSAEKYYYSATDGIAGKFDGQWLPILEKAYGTYRINHQDWWKTTLRFLKYSVLDLRFSSRPALPGFAASFGAGDEVGAQVLAGGYTKCIETTSFELGRFGLGKGYVTLRQLQSWFDRAGAEKQIQEQQNMALIEAMENGSVAVATTEVSGDALPYHLFSGHAYAVLGYNPKSRILVLKDPLCSDMWDPNKGSARDGIEDGRFEISLPEFNLLFSRLRLQMNEPV